VVLATAVFGQYTPFLTVDLPEPALWIEGGCAFGLGAAVLMFMSSDG
jgi:hypothetical protein